MKKEGWYNAFISACCGFVLYLVVGGVCVWLSKYVGEKVFDENPYIIYDIRIDGVKRYAVYLVINILLVVTGILAIRFREGIKQCKGKWAVMVVLLLIESPIIISVIKGMSVRGILKDYNIIIIACVATSFLIGLSSREYKIRTYLICCVLATVVSILCAVLIFKGIYEGRNAMGEMVSAILALQPFAVLFPIISLLKGLIVTQNINTDNAEVQKDISEGHCPYCGAEIENDMLFCKECGTKIS